MRTLILAIAKGYKRISTFFMELQINSDRYIWEIQRDFNQAFSYLKIEFFSKPHLAQQPSPAKRILSNQGRIIDLVKTNINSSIGIDENMSVADLEKIFSEQFGLSVQVFRRSGNIWLETTMTDGWSLRQQNEHGKEITIGPPKTSPLIEENDEDVL